VEGSCGHDNESLGSIKYCEILDERLTVSQEGRSSMELAFLLFLALFSVCVCLFLQSLLRNGSVKRIPPFNAM
jgi:hypothetical protein